MKDILVASLIVWLPKQDVVSDCRILDPGLLRHIRHLTLEGGGGWGGGEGGEEGGEEGGREGESWEGEEREQ